MVTFTIYTLIYIIIMFISAHEAQKFEDDYFEYKCKEAKKPMIVWASIFAICLILVPFYPWIAFFNHLI